MAPSACWTKRMTLVLAPPRLQGVSDVYVDAYVTIWPGRDSKMTRCRCMLTWNRHCRTLLAHSRASSLQYKGPASLRAKEPQWVHEKHQPSLMRPWALSSPRSPLRMRCTQHQLETGSCCKHVRPDWVCH